MLGKRSDQKGLWEADRLYLDYVGQDTFYGLLASLRGQLFSDDDFAEIYCPDNGRDSVPPSLLATALLLQTFADAGRRLVAKVPGRPNRKHFPKNDFHLDLAAGSCTCPAGQVTHAIVPAGKRTDRAGRVYRLQAFQFDGAVCGVCPLRSQCIAAQGRKGRRVLIHPQEGMLQQARALQQSADYDEYRARRVVVEHRLARLVQLGIRQARYFGRVKTKFQLYLAATVANLTLVAGKIGLLGSTDGGAAGDRVVRNDVRAVVANAAANFSAVRLGQLWSLILLTSALLPKSLSPTRVFQPGF